MGPHGRACPRSLGSALGALGAHQCIMTVTRSHVALGRAALLELCALEYPCWPRLTTPLCCAADAQQACPVRLLQAVQEPSGHLTHALGHAWVSLSGVVAG